MPVKEMTDGGNRVRQRILNMEHAVFDILVEEASNLGLSNNELNEFKIAFNEYMATEMRLFKEKGDYRFNEIIERIPDNIWVKTMQKVSERIRISR